MTTVTKLLRDADHQSSTNSEGCCLSSLVSGRRETLHVPTGSSSLIENINLVEHLGECNASLKMAPPSVKISTERLSSWFGITSNALSWLKSYLLNRSFSVNIEGSISSSYQLLYGVPQGSVLGPLLFILYTTPLSKVISDSSASHKLYADDTQLHLSFSAVDYSNNMAHHENTISNFYN